MTKTGSIGQTGSPVVTGSVGANGTVGATGSFGTTGSIGQTGSPVTLYYINIFIFLNNCTRSISRSMTA
jgi:hypothetical protein